MIGDYLIRFGSFGIPSMGFCILVGTIFALLLCYYAKRFTRFDWNNEILDAIIWAVIGGFIGMKVLYWIVTPEYITAFFKNPTWRVAWDLITTGMVFYGGLIGGVAAAILFCIKRKLSFFSLADLILPCFCIAHSGGRIGCLLVGCCYGLAEGESCLDGFYTYHGTCAVTYLNGVRRLPVPLMEAMFLILLAAVLLLVLSKKHHRGAVTAWYMILYSIWRFVIEFFRGDAVRGIYGLFSTSQWIGIAIFAAGIVILILSRKWPVEGGLAVPAAETVSAPEEPKEDAAAAPDDVWAPPVPDPSAEEPSPVESEDRSADAEDAFAPCAPDAAEEISEAASPAEVETSKGDEACEPSCDLSEEPQDGIEEAPQDSKQKDI